jgi:hypothetical protein
LQALGVAIKRIYGREKQRIGFSCVLVGNVALSAITIKIIVNQDKKRVDGQELVAK